MKIPKQMIDKVLEHYRPNLRMLKSASLGYPSIKGRFLIGPTFYYIPRLEHAADIEIQLCLNQLAYAGIAEIMEQGVVPELNGLNFYELQKENMLVIESRKRFRRPIRTNAEIGGELILRRWKDVGSLILGNFDFQFENKSCFGSLELGLVKPNERASDEARGGNIR
jgi:hypothetical protein